MFRSPPSVVFVSLLSLLSVGQASAGLQFGDIVFSQDGAGGGAANAVLKADPITGNQTIISQTGVIGTGPDFGSLIGGLAIDAYGQILLTAFGNGELFKIDPNTGNRTILSGGGVGTGPSIHNLNEVIIAPDGQIYVSAQDIQSIVRIDPLTGNRTVVSGPSMGSGPTIHAPFGLTQAPNGDFYSYDTSFEIVYHIDGTTGDRSIVSGGGVGNGVPFDPFGNDVALLLDGDLVTNQIDHIFRVDAATGDRTILSGLGIGSGPQFNGVNYLSVAYDGSIIASDHDAVYRIDPNTGDRTILTGEGVGLNFSIGLYREAAIYTAVPELSSLTLLGAFSVVTAVVVGKRKARN